MISKTNKQTNKQTINQTNKQTNKQTKQNKRNTIKQQRADKGVKCITTDPQ